MKQTITKSALAELLDSVATKAVTAALDAAEPKQQDVAKNPLFAPPVTTTTRKRDSECVAGAMLSIKAWAQDRGLNAKDANVLSEVGEHFYGEKSKVVETMNAKALAAGTTNSGSEMVAEIVSDDIIPALGNMTVMRRNGATLIDNPTGDLRIPRMSSIVAGTWAGEGASHGNTATSPGTDSVVMSNKQLIITVPVSKRLLMFGGPNTERAVLNNVLRGAAITEDAAFLRATGSATVPTGIRNQALAANVFAITKAGALATATEIEADLSKLKLKLAESNIMVGDSTKFLMSNRTGEHLSLLRDANGNKIYPELSQAQRKIGFYGVDFSEQIPNNLNTDESEVYLVNFTDVLIGDSMVAELDVLENVTYTDSGGNLQTTVDSSEVVVRLSLMTDIALQYNTAVAVATGVDWGT